MPESVSTPDPSLLSINTATVRQQWRLPDIISGFPIRDLDFTVQGNPLKLQKDLERAGVIVQGVDDDLHHPPLQG